MSYSCLHCNAAFEQPRNMHNVKIQRVIKIIRGRNNDTKRESKLPM